MLSSMGYGTYFFFAASTTIAFFWTYFILPETSGITLEEMDVLFGVPAAVRKEHPVSESGNHESVSNSEKKEVEMKMQEKEFNI